MARILCTQRRCQMIWTTNNNGVVFCHFRFGSRTDEPNGVARKRWKPLTSRSTRTSRWLVSCRASHRRPAWAAHCPWIPGCRHQSEPQHTSADCRDSLARTPDSFHLAARRVQWTFMVYRDSPHCQISCPMTCNRGTRRVLPGASQPWEGTPRGTRTRVVTV